MKRFLSLIFALTVLFAAKSGISQETKYKAMFLYNFTKHVGWPPTTKTGDFVIGILGNNAVYGKLNAIAAGKMAGNQNIVVRKYSNIEEMTDCHIIFVGSGKATDNNMKALAEVISDKNILIVTEGENIIKKGVVINFVIRDEQMRFELNKQNALKQGLQISLNLEKVAIVT